MTILDKAIIFGVMLTLSFALMTNTAHGATDTELEWDVPTTNTDGTVLVDLAWFKMYRRQPLISSNRIVVATVTANITNLVTPLPESVVEFNATAVNQAGRESAFSESLFITNTVSSPIRKPRRKR